MLLLINKRNNGALKILPFYIVFAYLFLSKEENSTIIYLILKYLQIQGNPGPILHIANQLLLINDLTLSHFYKVAIKDTPNMR
jgi:hypothetical protein